MQDNLDDKLQTIKPALSHLCMYVGLVAYTIIGAKVGVLTVLPCKLWTG